ncbi:hypothetical protein CO115_00180 [Candidatus Falkowbacteria bacterium CG_4_9_14_3_um_filter_36_9]|uniref:Uncharacterized protein n=2 Tax=Candidatus Falkowiibacteriota TaxID=1752728 RepID=A0A1J4T9G1_9BACT|nr:MAG: hypothetical protein AUJ27_02365 [Candidatus Falkowbacteria bacterium CG1_02_37_44]PIV51517.1 MAG: hypothetical protein COS18_02635 [Candidatus Falkowbacteria bacterium CG02_land_8_20_14_3_00_36_14]PJA10967.1 MAG: hypothetical protein COX67_02235 [Candidatus Falkowbacteria bacterium CG_4_10_14_0_2_um_filter_36_22]PJB20824.1 MAG: hypothetical protein CO115_00180 [Candidatus Falkowbacteria bacterium CG_4_9_14_3_um_filter_36_9]
MNEKDEYIELTPGYIVRKDCVLFLKNIFVHPDPCWILFTKIDYLSSDEEEIEEKERLNGLVLMKNNGVLIFSSEESANKQKDILASLYDINTENMKPLQLSWNYLVNANKYGLCHALIIQDDGNSIILPLIKEI